MRSPGGASGACFPLPAINLATEGSSRGSGPAPTQPRIPPRTSPALETLLSGLPATRGLAKLDGVNGLIALKTAHGACRKGKNVKIKIKGK
jgi:hypothetical protein